eukprot:5368949-Heterocapsa_arctica.AAC.1
MHRNIEQEDQSARGRKDWRSEDARPAGRRASPWLRWSQKEGQGPALRRNSFHQHCGCASRSGRQWQEERQDGRGLRHASYWIRRWH